MLSLAVVDSGAVVVDWAIVRRAWCRLVVVSECELQKSARVSKGIGTGLECWFIICLRQGVGGERNQCSSSHIMRLTLLVMCFALLLLPWSCGADASVLGRCGGVLSLALVDSGAVVVRLGVRVV